MKTHITTWLCCLCCALVFSQSITELEYFYNSDPGFGNAISVTPNANSGNLTQSITIATPTGVTGFNTLYIRAKDDANTWSLYSNAIFYILDNEVGTIATEITAAEYFINTDPGFGNGNAITISANTGTITENLTIPIGSNLNGFNSLYIRTQDDLGNWSLYDTVKFFVIDEVGSGATNITAMEYFIDTDPGFGNANSISTNSNTGSVSQNITIPLGSLEVGFHNLFVRAQDDLGVWSLYDKRTFFVTPEQNVSPIVSAEYFYDSDPGFGNGTVVTLTPTGNTDEFTIDLSTTDVSCDFHDFYIRLINEDGSWSLYDYGLQVEVYDNANPTIVTFPNITAELDASGNASITITDVDNGTFDDCELVSVVLNQAQFDYTCTDLGANTVTITATDAESKVSTEDVTITVVDNINPVAATQNITVQLDASGNASITPAQIENGSTDNCSVTGFSLDVSNFTCANLGTNTVNLTVTDQSGNSNTASATVTVVDTVKPTVFTQPLTVQLDASGNATITANDIDNGSSDNCTIANRSLDITAFTCTDLGSNTVSLTVTDQSGNSESASATVTVEDKINPTVVTQNITVQLDAFGNATITAAEIENGSSDNCNIANSSLDITSFDCSDLGSNTVTLSVTDQSGNTGTNTATVTVVDNINPVAITQNITVQLDATGNVSINGDDVDNSSTDNCGVTSKSLDVSNFTCANLGANSVMLTVEDASGNTNAASTNVTVEDNINPTVVTQNITAQLDASGNVTITAAQIENGSTDNCSIVNSSLDIKSFDCDDLGANTVTLSVTDQSGNTGTNTATVTVQDLINPVALGKDITVDLAGNASVTILASDVDNGSSDNCNVNLSIDINSFNTPGEYPVLLTATDNASNSNSVGVTVTVIDTTLKVEDNNVPNLEIKLFPIPVEDDVNISTELILDALEVYDINGKILIKIKRPNNKINLRHFKSGVYFFRFKSNNTLITKRVLKK